MNIYEITPENTYSCDKCRKEFESREILAFLWFCSQSCKFKYAFSICKEVFPQAKKEKLFALTKKVVEVSLK